MRRSAVQEDVCFVLLRFSGGHLSDSWATGRRFRDHRLPGSSVGPGDQLAGGILPSRRGVDRAERLPNGAPPSASSVKPGAGDAACAAKANVGQLRSPDANPRSLALREAELLRRGEAGAGDTVPFRFAIGVRMAGRNAAPAVSRVEAVALAAVGRLRALRLRRDEQGRLAHWRGLLRMWIGESGLRRGLAFAADDQDEDGEKNRSIHGSHKEGGKKSHDADLYSVYSTRRTPFCKHVSLGASVIRS
jgi:hypothetical protein